MTIDLADFYIACQRLPDCEAYVTVVVQHKPLDGFEASVETVLVASARQWIGEMRRHWWALTREWDQFLFDNSSPNKDTKHNGATPHELMDLVKQCLPNFGCIVDTTFSHL